jgi:glycosyltransferase involved in cell wall biosynthesis
MVEDGQNGLTVHAPITSFSRNEMRSPESVRAYRRAVIDERNFSSVVDALEERLVLLIEDGSLRRRIANNGFREVSEGRFSVGRRNEKLSRIYREALAEP